MGTVPACPASPSHDAIRAPGRVDGGDHTKRQAGALENGALLDMDLKIACRPGRITGEAHNGVRITAEGAQGLGQAGTIRIPPRQPGRIITAGNRMSARQAGGETHILLVAECEHLDGEGQIPRPNA